MWMFYIIEQKKAVPDSFLVKLQARSENKQAEEV